MSLTAKEYYNEDTPTNINLRGSVYFWDEDQVQDLFDFAESYHKAKTEEDKDKLADAMEVQFERGYTQGCKDTYEAI